MVQTINTLYCCCIANPWLDIVKVLNDKLNITPKYFIGWNDGSNAIQEKYEECFFQVIEDAWNGKGFPDLEYKYPLDETLLKSIAYEEIIAIKMMDRLDLDRHSFSFSDRQAYFYYLLKYWLVILEEYNINLVISPSIPHRVFDYVLYVAAKIKGIEFIMFQMTPFDDSSFIIDEINATPNYLKNYIKNNHNEIQLRESIFQKINQVMGHYDDSKPDYMKKQESLNNKNIIKKVLEKNFTIIQKIPKLFKSDLVYFVSKDKMPYERKKLKINTMYKKFKNYLYLKNLKKNYESMCIEQYPDKYVLVALQYQPEETSCPTGGMYASQELIIELLNDILPEYIDILVKEHKTQFYPQYEGATGRSSNFYNCILNISDRIKFISIEDDPFRLIDNAIATVTISGTIGWESVIRGTPALVFGRAWYEDMIGVFKIKSKDDLANNWEDIQKSKNNIDKNNILAYHRKIQHFFIDSAHYKAFVCKVKRDKNDNIQNIFIGIKNHLKIKNIID